jgi:predicted anti-sigma-YlaC factor YlaD
MNDCRHYETLLSTWLDAPLDRDEQTEAVDHLVRCPDCRRFWVDARALDGLIAAVRPSDPAAEAPSRELWDRIARSVERRPARSRLPVWALQAAAVLIVAFGISLALWNGSFAPAPTDGEVLLGQGDHMTDGRFIELTRELLGAESRYRSAMLRVLEQVERSTAASAEAASEEEAPSPEERDPGELREVDISRIPA